MRRKLAGVVAAMIILNAGLTANRLRAQEPGEQAGAGRGAFAGMQRVNGEVTAVSGMNLTIKAIDGTTTQVVTTTNTRLMKAGGASLKLTDVKPGDGVMAAGNLDAPNHTLHAAMIFWTDADTVKKMKENLGKTYIAGRVTAIDIDNAGMTVQRPDGVAQTIAFDETTSFKRGRPGRGGFGGAAGGGDAAAASTAPSGESITLAVIKVGDNVTGAGSIKAGKFVPKDLTVATPREHREGGTRPGATPAAPATPGASAPAPK